MGVSGKPGRELVPGDVGVLAGHAGQVADIGENCAPVIFTWLSGFDQRLQLRGQVIMGIGMHARLILGVTRGIPAQVFFDMRRPVIPSWLPGLMVTSWGLPAG